MRFVVVVTTAALLCLFAEDAAAQSPFEIVDRVS